MKPFVKRVLNVFAVLLNIAVVLAGVLIVLNVASWIGWPCWPKSWPSFDGAAGIFIGTILIVFIATINYLVLGGFRAWNRVR